MTQFACETEALNRRTLEAVSAAEAFDFGQHNVLAEAFATTGIAVMRRFILPDARAYLLGEIRSLMPKAMRKDFLMPQTGNSPRNMAVVGEKP